MDPSQRQRRNPITGFWEKIPEPRVVSLLVCLAYFVMACAGLSALLDPPQAVEVTFPSQFLIVYWATLLTVGGVVASASVLPGAYWAERLGSFALALGLVMYGITVFSFHQPDTDNRIPHLLTICALIVVVATRWARIWSGFRDPEKCSTYPPR